MRTKRVAMLAGAIVLVAALIAWIVSLVFEAPPVQPRPDQRESGVAHDTEHVPARSPSVDAPRADDPEPSTPHAGTDPPLPPELQLTADTSFRVVDFESSPVPGAAIEVRHQNPTSWDSSPLLACLSTDEAGHATWTQPRATRGVARVRAPGFVPTMTGWVSAGENVRVSLRRGVDLILDLVGASGEPVTDTATVWVIHMRRKGVMGSAYEQRVTGPTVQLTVPRVTSGWVRVLVLCEGYAHARWEREPWGDAPISDTLTLQRPELRRGTVVADATGEPIAGARVQMGVATTTSDESGEFAVPAMSTRHDTDRQTLWISHASYAPNTVHFTAASAGHLECRLERGFDAIVEVVTAGSAGLPDDVEVRYWYGHDRAVPTTASRIDGGQDFRLPHLRVASAVCRVVTAEGFAPSPFALASSPTRTERVRVELRREVVIEGFLHGNASWDAPPLAGQHCALDHVRAAARGGTILATAAQSANQSVQRFASNWQRSSWWREGNRWITDENGAFRVTGAVGDNWLLLLDENGTEVGSVQVTVPDDGARTFDAGRVRAHRW